MFLPFTPGIKTVFELGSVCGPLIISTRYLPRRGIKLQKWSLGFRLKEVHQNQVVCSLGWTVQVRDTSHDHDRPSTSHITTILTHLSYIY